jgi:hypothetical protein
MSHIPRKCLTSNHAKVAARVASRADRTELTRLDRREQLRLKAHPEPTDLVEERRAVMRFDEQPLGVAVCAGERTAHVTEKRILEHRLADRTHVERHECTAPAARLVQRRRHELLPGAGRSRINTGKWLRAATSIIARKPRIDADSPMIARPITLMACFSPRASEEDRRAWPRLRPSGSHAA